jgi:glycosyltransferase involved in cell wall biosynthesis
LNKLPISALVASYNEAHLLGRCLESINFCDEILVVDLQSNDHTESVAMHYTDKFVKEEKVMLVEELFPHYIPRLKNDWVMLIDPDEQIDSELYKDIEEFFKNIPLDCARINVPILYYYKNTALKGTVWGGMRKTGRLLVRKSGCEIRSNVHTAIVLKEGFTTYKIKREGNNVDHHYWVQSYNQMLEKHKRYTLKEGKAKYDKGERFSNFKLFIETWSAFCESFFVCKGYLDGFLGLFLSGFYAWYIWSSWVSLKNYQKQIKLEKTY